MISEHQIIDVIEKLDHKVKLLKNVCESAQKRVKDLEKANEVLRNKLQEKQTEANELRKKQVNSEKSIPMSKVVGILVKDNLSETDANAELKQQLDEYIRELERCVAHLSTLS